ncbi:MAG: hypothetical protein Q4P33_01430 [Flaviflexus sp.]|nr:hypothetical protein [Flaviflexus sp.]
MNLRRASQHVTRWGLGAFMTVAGLAHLWWARDEFHAQVPDWVPLDPDLVVVSSGIVELALGAVLVAVPARRKELAIALAVFFVMVFPGNLNQYLEGIDAFGLDTDAKRLARLFFQPPLILAALWAGGVWDRE